MKQKVDYIIQIDYRKTKCPVCNRKGKFHQDEEDLICECGCIISTPYNYVAGVKLTDIDFKKKITKK